MYPRLTRKTATVRNNDAMGENNEKKRVQTQVVEVQRHVEICVKACRWRWRF